MRVDGTRLAIFLVTGLAWDLAGVLVLDLTPVLGLLVMVYVVASALVLSVRTTRILLPVVVPWLLAVGAGVLLLLPVAGGVLLLLYGPLIGTALFWLWAAPGFLVLHALRGATPR